MTTLEEFRKFRMANRRVTHDVFVSRANLVHDSKYLYREQYQGSRTKITIVCPVHGKFSQYPYSHLEGSGCKQCDVERRSQNNKLTHNQFVAKALVVHDHKYSYPEKYQHSQQLISIGCPIHGIFRQLPYTHLLGNGCKKCADDERVGVYTEEYFVTHTDQKQEPASLYIFKLSHDNSNFIKVGITKNIKNRKTMYRHDNLMVDELMVRDVSLYEAWKLEQSILEKLKTFRYYPNIDFCGKTECLKFNSTVLDLLHSLLDNSDNLLEVI